ncbi:MAG TPA: hypothetical protein PLP33_29260 [Leptospiraceae bacterium]|nr:hypothetical protein [Leptospiraceae bacterium]
MDTVHIGNVVTENTAVRLFEVESFFISHSSKTYWYSCDFTGIQLRIAKDSEAGKTLAKFIKGGYEEKAKQFLLSLVFKHTPVNALQAAIQLKLKYSFENGKKEKAREIKIALGILD